MRRTTAKKELGRTGIILVCFASVYERRTPDKNREVGGRCGGGGGRQAPPPALERLPEAFVIQQIKKVLLVNPKFKARECATSKDIDEEINQDISDAIAKWEEANARLAEAQKNEAQAQAVISEIEAIASLAVAC